MRKNTQSFYDGMIYIFALNILDDLSRYINEYKVEKANKISPIKILANQKYQDVGLDPKLAKTIHENIIEKNLQKELQYKDGEWSTYLEENVEINDCFEAVLIRLINNEDIDDLEYELVTFNGGMTDRDWVNPHWENYKNRIIKNVCFYCACAVIHEQTGSPIKAIQSLLQASEMNGIASRIGPETYRSKSSVYDHIETAFITQKSNKKKRTKNSKTANDIKNEKYLARLEFAENQWLLMPEWHHRNASDTADKLIRDFKKLVPGKDKLQRLISVLKATVKN